MITVKIQAVVTLRREGRGVVFGGTGKASGVVSKIFFGYGENVMFNRSSACTFVLCCNMSNKTKNKTLHSHDKQANSPATKWPNVI